MAGNMNGTAIDKESRLMDFERTLVQLFDSGQFPLALVGDLDDLLFTLEEIASLLHALGNSEGESDPEQLRSSFSKLEIMLGHDLPMILKDVVPPLKRLSRRLPDAPEAKV